MNICERRFRLIVSDLPSVVVFGKYDITIVDATHVTNVLSLKATKCVSNYIQNSAKWDLN